LLPQLQLDSLCTKGGSVMGVYHPENGSLIKISSFPNGFIINNTQGTKEHRTTLSDLQDGPASAKGDNRNTDGSKLEGNYKSHCSG
jgi:hypothetical protein